MSGPIASISEIQDFFHTMFSKRFHKDLSAYLSSFDIGLISLKTQREIEEVPRYIEVLDFSDSRDYSLETNYTISARSLGKTVSVRVIYCQYIISDVTLSSWTNPSVTVTMMKSLSQSIIEQLEQRILGIAMDKFSEEPCKVFVVLPSDVKIEALYEPTLLGTRLVFSCEVGVYSLKKGEHSSTIEKHIVRPVSDPSSDSKLLKNILDTVYEELGMGEI